jgi:CRISPR-associated endonuclease/helicase Cas3
MELSEQARALWAKLPRDSYSDSWLPLYIHMADAAETAKKLWEDWLPYATKNIIARSVSRHFDLPVSDSRCMKIANKLLVFLAAAHDVGKAIPVFQSQAPNKNPDLEAQIHGRIRDAGLEIRPRFAYTNPHIIHHSLASQVILKRAGIDITIAVILGGHHGKPPSYTQIDEDFIDAWPANTGFKDVNWLSVQDELLAYAIYLADIDMKTVANITLEIPAQVVSSGLVIMTDWIVSDEKRFPYLTPYEKLKPSSKRTLAAWLELRLPSGWVATDAWEKSDLYNERFAGIEARPVQIALAELLFAIEDPGIIILEAPMGEGKTEAALVAAEIMAAKTGAGGVFFALPTQATSDGLFPRITKWIEQIGAENDSSHSIILAHGKSRFNEEYQGIKLQAYNDDSDSPGEHVVVNEWFEGRKKSVLASFVVGTIDQVLMGGLKQKHLALRHLGLANKVIIIDECHAYDAYMSQYLYKVLSWLGSYEVPVIILSATLPGEKRQKIIDAYLQVGSTAAVPAIPWLGLEGQIPDPPKWAINRSYPLITYSDGKEVKQKDDILPSDRPPLEVEIAYLDDESVVSRLDSLLDHGGCAGLIVNTVTRAQRFAEILTGHFGVDTVRLLHSRFISTDRIRKEKEIRQKLGPDSKGRPYKLIVVGTQVMEQSLDIDFDVLTTDICPMDLLIQRMGRLHRHNRIRPQKLQDAKCFITGLTEDDFDKGSKAVYQGEYMLINTRELLPDTITLPQDIPRLVQDAYNPQGVSVTPELQASYEKAKQKQALLFADKERRAQAFQVFTPQNNLGSLVGWLDTPVDLNDRSGKRAESTVRDMDNSLEVIVIQKKHEGYYMLPWLEHWGGYKIPHDTIPDDRLASAVARCTINLPQILTSNRIISYTIEAFEKNNQAARLDVWQESSWLKGELFLILDEDFSVVLDIEIHGDKEEYQMIYSKKFGLYARRKEE